MRPAPPNRPLRTAPALIAREIVAIVAMIVLAALFPSPARAAQAPGTPDAPPPETATSRPIPRIAAAPVDGPIHVDGRLDEPAWKEAEPVTRFTQRDPHEGEAVSESTEVRVLIGDEALYVGARLYDREPKRIRARLVRRDDDLDSDFFVVFLDSNHDRVNAVLFRVNPKGCVNDASVDESGNQDTSWDPVWHAESTIDSLGWTTEIEIPFSQLHYSDRDGVWGVQFRRFIYRKQELAEFSFVPKSEQYSVARYGELTGMNRLHAPRRLELVPYGQLRSEYRHVPGGDPFRDGSDQFPAAGLDLKYGVTSNLTLNATVNPDFGEVEVDPAVVNLTAFETFYPEKRPFFVEGADIFRFGYTSSNNNFNSTIPFHARRIGTSPHYEPVGPNVAYLDEPTRTTITAAGKLTGKTADGWTIGVLDALTPTEQAELADTTGATAHLPVEPRTNYFVSRLRRDFRRGNTVIGGLFTATNREDGNPLLDGMLRRSAYVGGLDFNQYWRNRSWSFDAYFLLSGIAGSEGAIAQAQTSSARYFQRPDATHLTYDPTRKSLSGAAGLLSLNKNAGKHWRGTLTYQDWSPGFEINDLGFQNAADCRGASYLLMYNENKPGKIFRYYTIFTFSNESWNYGGDATYLAHALHLEGQLNNYWLGWVRGTWNPGSKDDRLTRGGPLSAYPASGQISAHVDSDSRHSTTYGATATAYWNEAGGLTHSVNPYLSIRPTSALRISFEPGLSWNRDNAQYIQAVDDPTATATFGGRYVFATLDQTQLNLDTRVDWTFSPRLSFQLYAQPLVVSGDYYHLKELRTPGTYDFDVYGQQRGTVVDGGNGGSIVDPDGGGPASAFLVPAQNFNFRSLIGNAVLRWEYRPGSALFVVWQQHRQETTDQGDFDASRDLKAVFNAPIENVLAVKLTYWLGV
jgi:hypothetical protein